MAKGPLDDATVTPVPCIRATAKAAAALQIHAGSGLAAQSFPATPDVLMRPWVVNLDQFHCLRQRRVHEPAPFAHCPSRNGTPIAPLPIP